MRCAQGLNIAEGAAAGQRSSFGINMTVAAILHYLCIVA